MTLTVMAKIDPDEQTAQARAALQAGDFAQASDICANVLEQARDHKDALYMLAVAHRYLKQYDRALLVIGRLLAVDASFGRGFQERGHCLRDMGDLRGATTAYQNAVTHNGALIASWQMLATLHRDAGRLDAAEYANVQCEHLASLPPELLSVASLIAEGRYLRAEKLCRGYLQTHGHHIEAMRQLAEIGVQFNSFDEAEFLLESCVVLEPENIDAHLDYARVLRKRQKYEKALEQAKLLRTKAPGLLPVEMLYANENLAVGNFDEALDVYQTLLEEAPNNPGINLTLGHALKTVGRQDDAIAAYRRAYGSKPDFGDAFWSLANLKTYRFTDDEVAKMRASEASPQTRLEDRYHLCFALAKALEDRGDYAEAFGYYDRGNQLKREELKYTPERLSGEMQAQIEHCTLALFDQFKASGCHARDPIFIVGLPRAGSTLLEQILASHSQVEGTMELPNILALAHKLDGRRRVDEEARYPGNLVELTSADLTEFGEAFINDTAIYRKSGTPFFIDKMPNNFRHIGLIHMILPNAKIIDARRGAMGCCFSGFKQLFAEGQEFTYGLEEIGHYYRDYVALMDHWDAVLPGKVLRVHYEDVVADIEPQVRRILDYIGLPFEAACINFHQTERAVRTASSEQVRQPIFKSGLDQWAYFAPYLDPLRAILGPELAKT